MNWQKTVSKKRRGALKRLAPFEHGMCEIAGNEYYTSEALYGIDPAAYSEEALKLGVLRSPANGTGGEI
jgi:hypothetical protein